MNTIQHKAYIALPIETIIEYKKSDIIVFQLELCCKYKIFFDMANILLSKKDKIFKKNVD